MVLSLLGNRKGYPYWSPFAIVSIRGAITTGNHYDAWKKAGLKLGGYNYMIIATKGQNSTGKASITVGVAPKDVATA